MSILDTDMATKTANAAAANKACRRLFVDLSAYSDGELEGEAKTQVEQHLLDCEACRLRLDQMIHMRYQALRALATPGVPRGRTLLDLLKQKRDEEEHTVAKEPLIS